MKNEKTENKHDSIAALEDELTKAFINLEYSRITPLFSYSDWWPDAEHYAEHFWNNDPIFRRRVQFTVAGVLEIVEKYVK